MAGSGPSKGEWGRDELVGMSGSQNELKLEDSRIAGEVGADAVVDGMASGGKVVL